MAAVLVDDVRDVINVTQEEIADEQIQKMIKRATVTVELETNKTIDSQNCSDAQKEAIVILSAVYGICYLTGGSAVGLSFSVGDQTINSSEKALPLTVLHAELDRLLTKLRGSTLRSA